MSYGYAHQFVGEEQELSESDCPSDGQAMQHTPSVPPPDFQELYSRRKHQAINHRRNSGTYYHHQPQMSGYYDQHPRLPTTCPCNLPPEPRYYYYKGPPNQEAYFRSAPQLKQHPEPRPNSATTVKKHPITCKTPRFYRYTTTQIQRRPSTLCLPVAVQPDPGATSGPPRVKRTAPGAAPDIRQAYRQQEIALREYMTRSAMVSNKGRVDSEGDVNSRLNDLETFLTKFDDGEGDEEVEGEEVEEEEQVEMREVSEIAKILKPKIPSTLRAKHNRILKLKATRTNTTTDTVDANEKINKLEVKVPGQEPFEALLQALDKESPRKTKDEDVVVVNVKEKAKLVSPKKPEVVVAKGKNSFLGESKPALDDNSALELHKSKTYIVSLIDKALSKELGTIPGDKCAVNEFANMTPKRAVDLVNRHSGVGGIEEEGKKDGQCVCKKEEPLYIKQLKQLRWSHLRHIQREAKRLADLEKFLDTFNETDNPS